jgi:hypothetical protein
MNPTHPTPPHPQDTHASLLANRARIFALVFVALLALLGADASSCTGVTPDPGVGGGTGTGGGADTFAGIDPQVLNNESLKASALAYYLIGEIAASPGIDASVDSATLEAFAAQGGPTAEMEVNNWLATVDPSTIPTATFSPRYECTDEHQCPYVAKCYNAPYSNIKPHNCFVTDCGSSSCTTCPSWFPDTLKSLVFKSWCAYVCVDQSSPPVPVAVGAIGVRKSGDPFPATGAWCFAP